MGTAINYHYVSIFLKSILAGLLIGIAGVAYLSVDNNIIGSFLFSFGLITIIIWKLNLFTGKIGVMNLKMDKRYIPIFIIGNYLGTLLVSIFIKLSRYNSGLIEKAKSLSQIKINDSILSLFFLAVLCGVMMYLAVIGYNKKENLLLIIFPIMIFILCGFEHSIADMFYFNLAWVWDVRSIVYILVIILGNAIGSLGFKMIYKIN